MAIELAIGLEVLKSATPILLATLGAVVGQRAGVLNLGLEGTVYLSAAVAAAVGPPWGYVVAVVVGTLYNLFYYVLSNDFALNQILLGFAFTMVAYGIGSQIARPRVGLPLEKPAVQGIEVFLVVVAVAVVIHFFFKTRLGTAIRASGDDPQALDLLGIDVYKIRKTAGLIEGPLASSAGAYIVLLYYGMWTEPLPMGWGTLAVVTAMLSLWSPLLSIGASLIPSMFITLAFALQRYTQISPHLLNTIPYLTPIVVLAVIYVVARRRRLRINAPRWLARPYIREER